MPEPGLLRERIRTQQLCLLLALDEQRSIRRAAESLCITPSAASKQLKELEELVEVALFERHARGICPTGFGQALLRHARTVLGDLHAAHGEIVALREGLAGQVEVGAILTPALNLLPGAIVRVKRDAPRLRIGVHVDTSPVLIEMLRHGRLDFAIGRLPDDDGAAGLHYEEIAAEPVSVVARPGHPLLGRAGIGLEQLVALPWVLPPRGSVLRQRFERMLRGAGLAPLLDVVDTGAPLLVTELLQRTDRLHVMPSEVARHQAAAGAVAVLPVTLPFTMDPFGIVTRARPAASPAALRLLQAVREDAARQR